MEIPGTRSWGNWQFRSASLCGPSRDATASTCRVSNTAPHHSAAQAHLCDPFPPPSQSSPTESLLFYSFLHKPLFHTISAYLVKPSGSPPGRVPCLRIRLRRTHAAGTEHIMTPTISAVLGGTYLLSRQWDYKSVFNSYNHHHQRQRRALSCRYASEIQKFQCAPSSRI